MTKPKKLTQVRPKAGFLDTSFPSGGEMFTGGVDYVFSGDSGDYCVYLVNEDNVVVASDSFTIPSGQDSFSGRIPPNTTNAMQRLIQAGSQDVQLWICSKTDTDCPAAPAGTGCAQPVSVTVWDLEVQQEEASRTSATCSCVCPVRPYLQFIVPAAGDPHVYTCELPVVFIAFGIWEEFSAAQICLTVTKDSDDCVVAQQVVDIRPEMILYSVRLRITKPVNEYDVCTLTLSVVIPNAMCPGLPTEGASIARKVKVKACS
jgi:hypothetical protein